MDTESICDELKANVDEVRRIWAGLTHLQPWFSGVEEEGVNGLPELIVGLVEAALCAPSDVGAHLRKVSAAIDHGRHRREAGRSEHFILAEYHLLRQAIWHFLVDRFDCSESTAEAIMLIDTAITVATNASLWGYHREEAERIGLWEGIEDRLARESPLLVRAHEENA